MRYDLQPTVIFRYAGNYGRRLITENIESPYFDVETRDRSDRF